MSWSSILGHTDAIGRLRAALASDRLHPALLFEGPEGIGKLRVALTLAQALHCPQAGAAKDPCGVCTVCTAIAASAAPELVTENQTEHPGVRIVSLSRPDEREVRFGAASARGEIRAQIAVSQIRLVLAQTLAVAGDRAARVIVIDPADRLGEGAANALLKTLEEPPAAVRFVLVTTRPSAVLPTIASRCVRFRFGLLRPEEVRKGLLALKPKAAEPDLAVALSGGRIGRAIALAEGPSLAALKESRTLILEALEALARGTPAGTFAVIAGASFRAVGREDWTDAIAVLESLLRDLTVLAVRADGGGADVVNADLEDRLTPLAAVLGSKAARSLATLDAVRSDLRMNVNGRLAAERILLEIAR